MAQLTAPVSAATGPALPLGATPRGDGSCSFVVWAPHAERVELHLCDRDERVVELQPRGRGYHVALVRDVEPGQRYALRLHKRGGGDGGGEPWCTADMPDPASRLQPDGVHGPSAVVDHDWYIWRDDDWFGIPLRDYVLYELHVGTFTPEGTFQAVIPRLNALADLGVTAIELMPVAPFPGTRNWGYDGVAPFAVQQSYGGPDGLKELVDACHQRGIAVVLDVVYNHLGPEGNYLPQFAPYFSDRHHTPWGASINVDGPGSDEVRRYFVENALQWIADYHVDALRLDAIHGIVDTSAVPFLAELADAVAERAELLNRRAYLIAESDLNDVRVITKRSAGGLGHHAQWNDDFHHALHTALTGEREGYYADYAGLPDLARAYREGFVYSGQHSPSRGRRHGSRATGLPGERFVVYAQNHDQIGNRPLGDRLAASLSFEHRKLAAAATLLSPFVPMLFMGEEYGEVAPFPYFVSHTDAELVEAVRAGRAREFAQFASLTGEQVPDPQHEQTFRSAVLRWHERDVGAGQHLLAWHRALLRLRREAPSIARMRTEQLAAELDEARSLLRLARAHAGDETVVLFNFGDEAVALDCGSHLHEAAARDTGEAMLAGPALLPGSGWQLVLDSRDEPFGGDGPDASTLGALAVQVFRRSVLEGVEGA